MIDAGKGRNILAFSDSAGEFDERSCVVVVPRSDFRGHVTESCIEIEDGRFDVICSGSLLGIGYQEIESVSVGHKSDVELRPFDFEEFLWANGYGRDIADILLEQLVSGKPFTEAAMASLTERFGDFFVLGGMPAVVKQYLERKTFEGSLGLQKQILLDYEEDIQKYLNGLERTRVLSVFRAIAPQLAKENKKFQISKVARGARLREYSGCVEWLEKAGIVLRCSCLDFPELPIRGNVNPDKFKLYFLDTGLLIASLDPEAQDDLRANRNLGVYKGALYENFAASALVAQGLPLCYYRKEDGQLEEDFFARTADSLVPIEVKGGNGKAESLRVLIRNPRYSDIRFGIKLSRRNVGFENNVYTIPLFCAFLLRRFLKTAEGKFPEN